MENKNSINNFDFNVPFHYENGYYLTSETTRLAKAIAHWELYKKIVHLPGSIVEGGVFKGLSLIRWATYREILESQNSRSIIGFDMFGDFPCAESKDDNDFIKRFTDSAGQGISKTELETVLDRKKIENYELIQGNILTTANDYLLAHPELKISLLHIDVDVYEPTKLLLELFFDKVVKGGIIIFDDYSAVSGATKAIDEFLNSKNYQIQKLPYYKVPAFIIK